jgi:hypothetical protein
MSGGRRSASATALGWTESPRDVIDTGQVRWRFGNLGAGYAKIARDGRGAVRERQGSPLYHRLDLAPGSRGLSRFGGRARLRRPREEEGPPNPSKTPATVR